MKTLKILITAVATLLTVASLRAQDLAPIYGTFPGLPAVFAGSGTSNYTSVATFNGNPITLKANWGIAIIPIVACTNGTTAASAVGFTFDLSADGITYTTTGPLTNSVTMSGTNTIVGYTLFAPSVLNHMRYIRLSKVVNANTNLIDVSNIRFSYFPFR